MPKTKTKHSHRKLTDFSADVLAAYIELLIEAKIIRITTQPQTRDQVLKDLIRIEKDMDKAEQSELKRILDNNYKKYIFNLKFASNKRKLIS